MEERRLKLKSPNFVLSRTRLSVRNVPFSMTEAKLRSLAVHAVKERASREKPEVVQVR
jgi:nucleolar protein 4